MFNILIFRKIKNKPFLWLILVIIFFMAVVAVNQLFIIAANQLPVLAEKAGDVKVGDKVPIVGQLVGTITNIKEIKNTNGPYSYVEIEFNDANKRIFHVDTDTLSYDIIRKALIDYITGESPPGTETQQSSVRCQCTPFELMLGNLRNAVNQFPEPINQPAQWAKRIRDKFPKTTFNFTFLPGIALEEQGEFLKTFYLVLSTYDNMKDEKGRQYILPSKVSIDASKCEPGIAAKTYYQYSFPEYVNNSNNYRESFFKITCPSTGKSPHIQTSSELFFTLFHELGHPLFGLDQTKEVELDRLIYKLFPQLLDPKTAQLQPQTVRTPSGSSQVSLLKPKKFDIFSSRYPCVPAKQQGASQLQSQSESVTQSDSTPKPETSPPIKPQSQLETFIVDLSKPQTNYQGAINNFNLATRDPNPHERVHGVNAMGRYEAPFIGKKGSALQIGFNNIGNAVMVWMNEPQGVIRPQIANLIPLFARQNNFQYRTYINPGNSSWNNITYLFDEWSAYIIGDQTRLKNKNSTESTEGSVNFIVFGTSIAIFLEQTNQFTPQNQAILKNFIERSTQNIKEAQRQNRLSQTAKFVLSEFLKNPQAASLRQFLQNTYGADWFNNLF